MKNIVFDMGNVLTKYKLSDYIGTYTEDEAQAALLKIRFVHRWSGFAWTEEQ